jgi:hypothetical protein
LFVLEGTKVDPDLIIPNHEGKPYTVRYEHVNAMLVNEFLKEHRKIAELEATVPEQRKSFESTLAQRHKQIETLTLGLQKISAQIEVRTSAH